MRVDEPSSGRTARRRTMPTLRSRASSGSLKLKRAASDVRHRAISSVSSIGSAARLPFSQTDEPVPAIPPTYSGDTSVSNNSMDDEHDLETSHSTAPGNDPSRPSHNHATSSSAATPSNALPDPHRSRAVSAVNETVYSFRLLEALRSGESGRKDIDAGAPAAPLTR